MLTTRRGLCFKTDEGAGGTGTSAGSAPPEPRKAEGAVVDQVHSLHDRVTRLETPFYERLFKDAEKPPPAAAGGTPPATPEVKTAAKPKRVIDELSECMDPFGLFDEAAAAPPVKTSEAPASDEAAA